VTVGVFLATRRRLLGGAPLIGASPRGAGVRIVADDAGLLAAAASFCILEHRMRGLVEGPASVADDDARHSLLRPIRESQAPYLDVLCHQRALGLAGHRARAAAFAAWDGGELAEVAAAQGLPADRLLAALVRDLVEADA